MNRQDRIQFTTQKATQTAVATTNGGQNARPSSHAMPPTTVPRTADVASV
jgi:hypothetical protein